MNDMKIKDGVENWQILLIRMRDVFNAASLVRSVNGKAVEKLLALAAPMKSSKEIKL